MNTLTKYLYTALYWLSITLFAVLVLDVLLGVFSRYVFGNQVRWTEELATFLMVWLVFCGASIAYHDKAHLGINLLVNNLEPGASKITQIVAVSLVTLFVVGIMVIGGIDLTVDRWEAGQMMSTLGIKKAWLYLTVPLNGLFITVFSIERLIETLKS